MRIQRQNSGNIDTILLAAPAGNSPTEKLRVNGSGGVSITGDAVQDRGSGGLVKAMAFVNEGGTIVRCYNSQASGALPTCGFTINGFVGNRHIDFGFNIGDRFISVVSEGSFPLSIMEFSVSGSVVTTANRYISNNDLTDVGFFIFVY